MESAIRTFFSSPKFAVVGASDNPSKYGYKVLSWYLTHNLPVTGINPKTPTILSQATIASLQELQEPTETSVSIITPPMVTMSTLKTAKELGVPAVWMQPGSFDEDCLAYCREVGLVAVAGGGACVLVDGENGLTSAGKSWKL